MSVVSVSLPEDILSRIDRAADKTKHPGRSAFVREALRHYLDELEAHGDRHGPQDALLVVSHDHDEKGFSALRHAHQGLVRAHLHQDANQRCHEILLLNGPSERIRAMIQDAHARTYNTRWYPLR